MKHEPVTARELRKQARPSCSHCGSSAVRTEAFAKWNERIQDWRVSDLLDGNSVCGHCGRDCTIKWLIYNTGEQP